MKTFIRTFAFLTMLSMVVISCKKKEEEAAPKTNFIIVDGTEFTLKEGVTLDYGGTTSTGYNFDLLIGSASIDFSDFDNSGMKGNGDVVYFELWSTSASSLATGSYSFNNTAKANTYTDIYVAINYNTTDETADSEYNSGTGTVTIKTEGDTYIIDFDITLIGDKKMTGNFTGKLTNYKQ